jgi:hemolysin-activating ACP:hemolysin acyltransferase
MNASAALNPQTSIGLALWALVSEEVAAKLAAQKKAGARFRLAPQEWKSGPIPWLLDIVGDPRAVQAMYRQLLDTVFKGQKPRGFEPKPGPGPGAPGAGGP